MPTKIGSLNWTLGQVKNKLTMGTNCCLCRLDRLDIFVNIVVHLECFWCRAQKHTRHLLLDIVHLQDNIWVYLAHFHWCKRHFRFLEFYNFLLERSKFYHQNIQLRMFLGRRYTSNQFLRIHHHISTGWLQHIHSFHVGIDLRKMPPRRQPRSK